MKPMKMAALMLAGMALVGMTYSAAGQRAFAHDFSEDESATFLVDVWAAKVHLMLVGRNLDNPDAALAHIDHVRMILNDDMLAEIAERNERIADDIPAALDDLATMIENGEDRSVIVGQFRDISSLLAEAVSVRIDSDHVEDPHIQVLIVAGLVDNVLASYEQAYGVASSEHDHDVTEEDDHMDEGSMEEGGQMMEGSMEHSGIVSHDSYVAAKLFATLAKNTFYREHLVTEGSDMAEDAQAGLVDLRNAVYAKESVDDVTVKTHIGVHEVLRQAYDLELAGEDGSHMEGEHEDEGEHEEDDHMEEQEHEEGSMEENHMEG